jgi:hypothetical protein
VLAEVPLAAVKPHLQRREPPPRLAGESHLEFGGDIGWVLRFG